MKIESLAISGLRKLKDCEIRFGDATFIIGENNVGKSTVFRALELILKNITPTESDYTMALNQKTGFNEKVFTDIVLTSTFRNIPIEADNWTGFRGRIFIENETRKIKYKKTFGINKKIEIYQQGREINDKFKNGKKLTIESIISGGIEENKVLTYFKDIDHQQNLLTKTYTKLIESFYDIWEFNTDFEWITNPGGIPQNIISKLPKFILIPAEDRANEIECKKSSALGDVMTTIFEDVVESSQNFHKAKTYFDELEKEIDTENQSTEFGKIMIEINETIKTIFPDSEIYAKINLSDPNTFLKPNYDIKLGSNILTEVSYQGTGMIRTTAFSLLKYREEWRIKRDKDLRNLIICFEEPELFLHPNAASQMRDTIYELAGSTNQIICTSHSPFMIDLSREKEHQIINNMIINDDGFIDSTPFSVTEAFIKLQNDDKSYVKMLLKIDDYLARAFFARKVIIIEGDTEDIVLRKTISLLTAKTRNKIASDFQIVKARGKATIPPLINYFKAVGITNLFIIHDRDKGVLKAEEVNPRILETLKDESKRIMLEECIENTLGYPVPSREKPYKAFEYIENWKKFEDIPIKWKDVIKVVFSGYIE